MNVFSVVFSNCEILVVHRFSQFLRKISQKANRRDTFVCLFVSFSNLRWNNLSFVVTLIVYSSSQMFTEQQTWYLELGINC